MLCDKWHIIQSWQVKNITKMSIWIEIPQNKDHPVFICIFRSCLSYLCDKYRYNLLIKIRFLWSVFTPRCHQTKEDGEASDWCKLWAARAQSYMTGGGGGIARLDIARSSLAEWAKLVYCWWYVWLNRHYCRISTWRVMYLQINMAYVPLRMCYPTEKYGIIRVLNDR